MSQETIEPMMIYDTNVGLARELRKICPRVDDPNKPSIVKENTGPGHGQRLPQHPIISQAVEFSGMSEDPENNKNVAENTEAKKELQNRLEKQLTLGHSPAPPTTPAPPGGG